jgi:hypothetical protein
LLGPLIASMGATKGGAYGNFGQNNHFADYVTLALISVLYLQIKGRLSWHAAAACFGVFLSTRYRFRAPAPPGSICR